MEYTKEYLRELAESIYDLDAEVYAQLGSSLGRVFNRDREGCVNDIIRLMLGNDSHQLRSELALISNMARTIEKKEVRSMIMTEYNRILMEVIALPDSFASSDVLDEKIADLNTLQFKTRFGNDHHRIICISRTYGSGGNEIGFMLADKLKINYYDAEIFSAVLKRLQADQDEQIRDNAAYPADKANQEVAFAAPRRMTLKERIREFSRYHGLSKRDAVFFNQSDLICDMAKKATRQTKLALARKKLKKTQQDLAYESGVSLRSIQMYEQRQRNINEASVTSVRAIAKALHCNIEDLLEPVFEYKETSAA